MKSFIVIACLLAVAFAGTGPLRGHTYRPRQERDKKIVGGSDTDITAVPWQIALEGFWGLTCGGSIANEKWVITAAHCVDGGSQPYDFTVRSGTSALEKGGYVTNLVEIIIYPTWDPSTAHGDCALLQVETQFTFDTTRQPIALATTEPSAGDIALISGWGTTQEDGSLPNILQSATYPIVSRADCDAVYENIDQTQICAGTDAGGINVCQGDSGGPLVVNNLLAGITSGGIGCARPGIPAFYGNVAYFNSWITENIS